MNYQPNQLFQLNAPSRDYPYADVPQGDYEGTLIIDDLIPIRALFWIYGTNPGGDIGGTAIRDSQLNYQTGDISFTLPGFSHPLYLIPNKFFSGRFIFKRPIIPLQAYGEYFTVLGQKGIWNLTLNTKLH
ncbi:MULTISPECIES: hypothetical protein [unclassified Bacillus (in: firmicutes)]|uniref:hypothetical protein n=1 Tax=unclassified Bacillus (in: firmicutes) TaxID=185979 RepID=UPI0008F1C24D|nr:MULTISPECIES: hypothetical protein [unclassified Bacillus (in: firmicutes)]SFI90519.1 hypothetical protein SAMN04488574_10563 [Bacillus sp. 71mf]SFS66396.1 hypothetical protein SAMN04488145_102255 [Bacillus sp. 103mf]